MKSSTVFSSLFLRLTGLGGLVGGVLYAAQPGWWTEADPTNGESVIKSGAAESSRSPANVGQAKWMTRRAIDSLWPVLPDVANTIEDELVNGSTDPGRNSSSILSLDAPGPGEEQVQYSALQIGQVKAISEPFYFHIQSVAAGWLDNVDAQHLGQLQQNQSKVDSGYLPWTSATADDVNNAVANLGQLKTVFSLRFKDSNDGDTLPDLWEWTIVNANGSDGLNTPSDVLPGDDFDGDGKTNLQEYDGGTDPTGSGYVDADDDGRPDITEPGHLLDPKRKDNPAVGLRVQFFSR